MSAHRPAVWRTGSALSTLLGVLLCACWQGSCGQRHVDPVPGSQATVPWIGDPSTPQVTATIGATIAGHAAEALLDTGYTRNLTIPLDALDGFGLSRAGPHSATATATGSRPAWQVPDAVLGVGGLVERISAVDANGDQEQPLLGMSWMLRRSAIIDCERRLLVWPPSASSPMGDYAPATLRARGFAEIPLRLESLLLRGDADIAGRPQIILIDTGCQRSIIDRSLADTLGIDDPHASRVALTRYGLGTPPLPLGGTLPTIIAIGPLAEPRTFLTLDLSTLNRSFQVAYASESTAPIPHVDCVLGMDFLNAHQAIIDIGHQRLFLRPLE